MASTDFLVAGLGNPGPKYVGTPHNAGFAVVDRLAAASGCRLRKRLWFRAAVGRAAIAGVEAALMQPLTYMNRSGHAVAAWMRYHRLPVERLVVVVDDIDRPLGTMRLRGSGGSGGHKGLRSVIEQLGTDAFPRLRIGVGRERARDGDVVRHVLTPFSSRENEILERVLNAAAQAVECLLAEGVAEAMNRFNGWVAAGETAGSEPSAYGVAGIPASARGRRDEAATGK